MTAAARSRDDYVECCAAARQAFERAAEHRPSKRAARLTLEHYRVLTAVVSMTALWSKLSDSAYTEEVAELAGLHVKNAQQRLRELNQLGIIVYRGARGRGKRSFIALPEKEAGQAPDPALNNGAVAAPLPVSKGEPITVERGSRLRSKGGAAIGSPTEKTEKNRAEQERRDVENLVDASLSPSVIDRLLDLLPAREIKPNTRSVLARKFSQLPPHFVEIAREELLAAEGVRSRIRYLNGIANRMLNEQTRTAERRTS